MRKIKLDKWKAKNIKGEEYDESLLVALNVLIVNKKPEEMPRGLDKFRLFNKLAKAFDEAEKSGVLSVEEAEYKFLRDTLEKDIPSSWGMNPDISKAVEAFLDAKEE